MNNTVNNILTETETTNLTDAYVALCDAIVELEGDIETSLSFSPATTSRVVVLSRRDVMEQDIRKSLQGALVRLLSLQAECSNELGWDTVDALHYYGA